jgi:hypothetical protein
MALHMTPQEHDADPPSNWTVRKAGRRWQLISGRGGVLDTFDTKTQAEAAKAYGFMFDLYQKEGRWFRGEPVSGWRPYADIKAERERRIRSQTQAQE